MAISFVDAPIQPRCSALQEDFFLKEATHKEKGRLKQNKTSVQASS